MVTVRRPFVAPLGKALAIEARFFSRPSSSSTTGDDELELLCQPPGKFPVDCLFLTSFSLCIISPRLSNSAFAPATIIVELGGGVICSK